MWSLAVNTSVWVSPVERPGDRNQPHAAELPDRPGLGATVCPVINLASAIDGLAFLRDTAGKPAHSSS